MEAVMRSLLMVGAVLGGVVVFALDHAQAASLTFPALPLVTPYLWVDDSQVTVTGEEVVVSGKHVVLMHAEPERTSPVLARINVGTKLTTDGKVVGEYTRVFRGNMMGWVVTKFLK
jgi:hypothetical protein